MFDYKVWVLGFIDFVSEFFFDLMRAVRFYIGGKIFYLCASLIEFFFFLVSIEYDFFIPLYEKEELSDSDDTDFL